MFHTVILMYSIGQKNVTKKKVKKIVITLSSNHGTAKSPIMIESNHLESVDENGEPRKSEMSWDWKIAVIILACTTAVFGLSCKYNIFKVCSKLASCCPIRDGLLTV